MKRAFIVATLVVAGLATWGAPGVSSAAVPNPIVTGPIEPTAVPGDPSHGYPFFSTNIDLASRGYVEAEYFFEGFANTYNVNPAVTKLDTAIVTGGGYPYRTRMVVRRPLSPLAFNGTVIMEWQNDTAGYNLDALWVTSYEHFMRRGYAWVGVSAQRVGLHTAPTGLKAWSPGRYSALDVTAGGTITNDGLMWDIFSQAAQAVRSPQGVDPMAGLQVKRVYAMGASQSATRLASYHNSIHPLAQVVDGIGLIVGGGVLRTDLDVKVLKLLSETDVAGNSVAKSQAYIRQADSDHFRRWEVAGSAHLDFHLAQGLAPLQVRDGMSVTMDRICNLPTFSRIPLYFVAAAAYDHMDRWVRDGVAPPQGSDIEVSTLAEQITVLSRDALGNALGGIRLPQHAVPTATNSGLNFPDLPATNFCRTFGSYFPFDEATLAGLYRNHGTYVSAVTRATTAALRKGFMVEEDAESTRIEAAKSTIGKP